MSLFSTEFYLKNSVGRAEFLAEARAWVQGMKRTQLFGPGCTETLDGDNVRYEALNGESLMFRALAGRDGLTAVGCRHDVPADNGLNWRTEAVMRCTTQGNLLRVRAQCLPVRPLAVPETPKRTHLIRSLIENGRVRDDGPLTVQTTAHHLKDSDEGQSLAAAIASGNSGCALPVIYVSASDGRAILFDESKISALALEICGLAHVVVEPSRAFSFAVRDRSGGRNVYAGTVGISVPGRGFVRRMFLGPVYPDAISLAEAVRRAAVDLRTATPSQDGWDWHDLQDHILADQRGREARRLSAEDSEKLWKEELATKDEQIAELQAQVSGLLPAHREATESETGRLVPMVDAPEIYQGEFTDRIVAALRFCLERGRDAGWDNRSLSVFERVLAEFPQSNALDELRQDLKRAARDPGSLCTLLERHGFARKSENKHIRLEPRKEFSGLDSLTIPKTPSDHRGAANLCSQIEGILGITRLKNSQK